MGANAGKSGGSSLSPNEFVNLVAKACQKKPPDLEEYKRLWESVEGKRDPKERANKFDKFLLEDGCMDWLKFAFRNPDVEWRRTGIKLATTFFHLEEAKNKFTTIDFISSVLLITLPGQDAEEGEIDAKASQELEANQLLAAETFNTMADHAEFEASLTNTSVLNFLCIVLNLVPRCVETVTQTFVKLSENPANLVVLMEGAVGDILESFFKTVDYRKPQEDENEKVELWKLNIKAMSHCAHCLATLIKYGNECQVDSKIIMTGFQSLDNVRLLAEMTRLFFWMCRRSRDLLQTLMDAAPDQTVDANVKIDKVLEAIVNMWKRCCPIHSLIQDVIAAEKKGASPPQEYVRDFCKNDLTGATMKIADKNDKEEIMAKRDYAQMRTCFLNCTLWVLLPIAALRWKLHNLKLTQLYLAFDLRDESNLQVVLGTVRYLVDLPAAQICHDLIKFFGEQLLVLLEEVIMDPVKKEKQKISYMCNESGAMVEKSEMPLGVVQLLLDSLAILAMTRDMQEMLASYDVWKKLMKLTPSSAPSSSSSSGASLELYNTPKVKLAVLRVLAVVSMHPTHRLSWVNNESLYPPREEFEEYLDQNMESKDKSPANEMFTTIAALLIMIFKGDAKGESSGAPTGHFRKNKDDVRKTFESCFDFWSTNTTAMYQEEKEREENLEGDSSKLKTLEPGKTASGDHWPNLDQLLKEKPVSLSVMDTQRLCAPYESVVLLSLFARLALEPKFKSLFFDHKTIDPLLACVLVGIWAEAREAAACIANLCWHGDLDEERLVCWLKFDGPKCIAVDASCVLLPIKVGQPKAADIGKGMYKKAWGVQFEERSSVILHPDGLCTARIPGLLTSSSPSDTFATTAQTYQTLDEDLHEKHFTVSCWFYWPLRGDTRGAFNKVLLQTHPKEHQSQISIDCVTKKDGDDPLGVWCITLANGQERRLKTPKLKQGWHMLALVSSTEANQANTFEGTRFHLDEWHCDLKGMWVKNEFYMVGNDAAAGGKMPFGMITDFRIYAKSLTTDEIKEMVQHTDTGSHLPHKIVQQLAERNAATILAKRLDVPDSAAECLRALGNLATMDHQRAKIFSLCGTQVLEMLESPLPMIRRQAARLVQNMM